MCEILCLPFKNGVYLSQLAGCSKSKLHWPLATNALGRGEVVFPVQDSQAGELDVALILWENFSNCNCGSSNYVYGS